MKEPQTKAEIEEAARTWLANIVGWKRRYVESLQNEVQTLRERLAQREQELRDKGRGLADQIRRAHAELGVPTSKTWCPTAAEKAAYAYPNVEYARGYDHCLADVLADLQDTHPDLWIRFKTRYHLRDRAARGIR